VTGFHATFAIFCVLLGIENWDKLDREREKTFW